MEKYAKRFTKQEKSWILYDWANSVYATNIMAAIFPIYFGAVCESAGVDNVQVWGYGTSAATLVVAVMGPVLGAVGDHKGMKKKLFTGFLAAGVLFTLMMAVFDQWQLLLAGYVISYIGFAGSCLFYDSFLTDVTTEERMDRVSSWGYAMGYIGGSTIPFVISIAVLLIMGMDNPAAVKFSVVITSVWWLIFSIPILKNVNQTHYIEAPASKLLSHTFQSLKKTLREIFRNKTIFIFIIAYFFYIDGVGTVIHMATSYGTNLGLDTTGMIIALLVTQIVAMPCSILFGRASGKFSSIKLILFAIAMYLVICVLGFYMGFHVEQAELDYIIRDHDADKFEQKKVFMWACVDLLKKKYGDGVLTLTVKDQYFNMRKMVEPHPQVIDKALEAMERAGVKPLVRPIRGGTDGARLSFMGLPCPNLFTGGMNFHGKFEYCSLTTMRKAQQVILNLAVLWSE